MKASTEAIIYIAVGAIFIIVAISRPYIECHSRWNGSKFESRWGIFSGCQIKEKSDIAWLPEDKYKVIDLGE